MTITLSPETQRLLEEQMQKGGYATPDEALRVALEALDPAEVEPLEDLDPVMLAANERAEAQAARGTQRGWAVSDSHCRHVDEGHHTPVRVRTFRHGRRRQPRRFR